MDRALGEGRDCRPQRESALRLPPRRREGLRCRVFRNTNENWLTEFVRRSMRRLLGCDLVHAWRNKKQLLAADVVWTHTELEHLAVLALWQFRRRQRRPRLIAQSVWLFDRWHTLSKLRRWLYRHLLRQADVLTVHSTENLKVVRKLFPQVRSELVPFGINSDVIVQPVRRTAHNPVRIVSLGSDIHRDWKTLIAAVESWPGCQLRIASKSVPRRLIAHSRNVQVSMPRSAREVAELYTWADLAVVSLMPNLHASGLTVIFEAVLYGLPVVCTDTGGIRGYFRRKRFTMCHRATPIPYAAAFRISRPAINCASQWLIAHKREFFPLT